MANTVNNSNTEGDIRNISILVIVQTSSSSMNISYHDMPDDYTDGCIAILDNKHDEDRNWARAIAFTTDGRVLVSTSSDGMVRQLKVDDESRKKTLEGLLAVAFIFDGKVLEMVRHVSKPSRNPDQSGAALISTPPPRNDHDGM